MQNDRREYDIGDRVRLTGIFKADGVPADPSSVKFQIRKRTESGHEEFEYTEPPVVVKRLEVGVYEVVWTWNESGVWYYRFVGSGALGVALETKAIVRKSETLNR
jgi:hypothetical protein